MNTGLLFWMLFLSKLLPAGHGDMVQDRVWDKHTTVVVQPMGKIPRSLYTSVFRLISVIVPHTRLAAPAALPTTAYYVPRHRYRADSLIRQLAARAKTGQVYLGLTTADISTTRKTHTDYGIMGLAYQPGRGAVASTYRLHQQALQQELFIIAIHELGHTTGLPHCPQNDCIMQDAAGKNKAGRLKVFCTNCRKHLEQRGWKL